MLDQAADPAELRPFLLGLAEGMTAAGESVDAIYLRLERTAVAYGSTDTEFVVLPTVVLVQTGGVAGGRVGIRSREIVPYHFHQIAALYKLISRAQRAEVEPRDGLAELAVIRSMKPRFGWIVRTLGHAVLTVGLSLLLVPSWQGAAVAFALGIVIGLAKLARSTSLQLVLPTVSAFVCAAVVFTLARFVGFDDPLRLLIAPLATFLPGAALTTATVELASHQMIAGASRLVTGLVELALLACGILAAGAIVGYVDGGPVSARPEYLWWTASLGVVLFAVGIYFYLSVPTATFGWVVLALFVAFAAQSIGSTMAGPAFSGFIGAVVVAPVVLLIATLPRGAPSQLTFLPAFWLLVPGASGLIGLTEAAAVDAGVRDFTLALTTVLSIALGVLIGTALFRAVAEAVGVARK